MKSPDMLLQIVLHLCFKCAKLTLVGIVDSMSQHVNLHLGLLLHLRTANVALEWTGVRMLEIVTTQMTPENQILI